MLELMKKYSETKLGAYIILSINFLRYTFWLFLVAYVIKTNSIFYAVFVIAITVWYFILRNILITEINNRLDDTEEKV